MTEVISSNLLQNILLPTISLRYNPGAYSESFKISKWQWFGGYWKKTKNPVAVDGTLFLKILYKAKKLRYQGPNMHRHYVWGASAFIFLRTALGSPCYNHHQ